MIWIDMKKPNSCGECPFVAEYDDGGFACVLLMDDSGMKDIANADYRLYECPLMEMDDVVREMIEARYNHLFEVTEKAEDEMAVLERYL